MADLRNWNPWHGCTKYTAGCKHCYMYFLNKVRGVPERSSQIQRTNAFHQPLQRNRQGHYKFPPGFCFRVNMTSDTFLEEADKWRDEMWQIIRTRSDVMFYLLTKRVERIAEHLPADWGEGYENVILNISCEDQKNFDRRWRIFQTIPAKHKGLNLAPLLGEIDITPALASGQIERVNLGGEGFGGDRPCHYEWIAKISEDCERYQVNFVVNTLGKHFVMNGKTYHLAGQQKQSEQAFHSGLSRHFRKIQYKLYDPDDGHLLHEDELMQSRYNANKCVTCPEFEYCIGCVNCGGCGKVRLVSPEEIQQMRNALPPRKTAQRIEIRQID